MRSAKKSILSLVCSDPVIQLYLTRRIEKYGRISNDVNTRIRTAAYKFLKLCEVEPTNHAFSDLVAQRLAASPQDRTLEKNLKAFHEAKLKYCYSTHIRGIFKANGIVLFPAGVDSEFKTLHVWTPRRPRKKSPLLEIVAKDPAIDQYFEAMKAKKRNNGYMSHHSVWRALNASTKFLAFLNTEVTDHAITDLIKWKQNIRVTSRLKTNSYATRTFSRL